MHTVGELSSGLGAPSVGGGHVAVGILSYAAAVLPTLFPALVPKGRAAACGPPARGPPPHVGRDGFSVRIGILNSLLRLVVLR